MLGLPGFLGAERFKLNTDHFLKQTGRPAAARNLPAANAA
jgi:hypothetical protein